ncbi:zinc knuckle-domain-containing protein [Amylocystis lapponica]|nr:zinc knuckle-domain-containing protein [Amylocystis lapponica]
MSKFAPHGRSANQPRATPSTVCQKCLGTGHFTYQCKSSRPYISRPSRTQQLENPRVLAKLKTDGKPSVEVPDEFKTKSGTANRILEAKEKQRAQDVGKEERGESSKKKRRRCVPVASCLLFASSCVLRSSSSSSGSDSSSSGSDSGSDSNSDSGSDSDSGSSSSSRSDSRSGRSSARGRSRGSRSPSRTRRRQH